MKPTLALRSFLLGSTVFSALFAAPFAQAITYYWDTDDAGIPGFGDVAGTWGTDAFWGTDPAGSGATANTTITNADGVNFGTSTLALGSTASTIGIESGGVTANSITFGSAQATPVTLSSGGGSITLDGTTPTITVDNASNTIAAVLAGTVGFTKAGTGTLNLTNTANSISGGITIASGAINATAAGSLGTNAIANNATLNLTGGGNTAYTFGAVSGAGTTNISLGTGTDSITFTNATWSGLTAGSIINVGVGQAASSGKAQFNSALPSTATVNVTANSTLFSSAAVTHNAPITLNGGTTGEALGQLRLDTGAIWAGQVTLAANTTVGTFSGTGTIQGDIVQSGGARNLQKLGNGTMVLSGINSYTGNTTVSGGTLNITNAANTTTGVFTIGAGSILNLASFSNYGVASAMGSRPLSSETSGSNSATSGIGLHINGGTLQYTGSTAQSTNRMIRIKNGTTGGTIDASGSDSGTLSFTGTTNVNLFDTGGTRTLTLTGTNTGANTFNLTLADQGNTYSNGVAAGATSLTKSGSGNWDLTGGNIHTGVTTISGGTLTVNSLANAGTQTTITTTAGSANATVANAAGLAIGMTVSASSVQSGNSGIPTPVTITGISGNTLTLSSGTGITAGTNQNAVIGVANPLGLAPVAASNLVINGGALRYTGNDVSINRGFTTGTSGGTVTVSTSGQTLTTSGAVTTGNGTAGGGLTVNGAGTLSLSGTVALNNTGNSLRILGGKLTTSGTVTNTNGNIVWQGNSLLTVAGGTFTATKTTAMGNSGAAGSTLTMAGGTFIQNGGSGAAFLLGQVAGGNSTINLNSGTFQTAVGFTNMLATGNALNFNGGTFKLGASITNLFSTPANVATTVNSGGAVIDLNSFSTTIGSTLLAGTGDGSLTLNSTGAGGGTLTLTANNTYTGGTFVNAGTLFLRTDLGGRVGSGTVTVAGTGGANFEIWAPTAVTLTNNIVLNGATGVIGRPALNHDGGAGKVTLSGTVTLNATSDIGIGGLSSNDMEITGVVSGVGGMIVDEKGSHATTTRSLILSGANTYTGPTRLKFGTLKAGVASVANVSGAFGNNSAVTLDNAANTVMDITGFNTQIGSLTGGGTTGGNVTLGAATLTVGGDNTSPAAYGGVISGTGGLTKIGSGTQILSGVNTYTGTTSISAGTIRNGSATTFTNKGALSMSSTGIFDLGGFNANFTSLSASVAGNNITNTGSTDATLALSNQANTVIAARIVDGTTNKTAVSLVNNNSSSNLLLTNTTNTFSGGLTLAYNASTGPTGTRLRITSPISGTPFGTGAITIGQAGTDKAQILLDTVSNNTLANDIIVNTALGTDVAGALRVDTGGHTLSGKITANLANAKFLMNGAASSMALTGQVTGSNGLEHNTGVGTLTLNNTGTANNYAGNTTVGTAAINSKLGLGSSNQIPNGSGAGNVVLNGTLNLNGNSDQINGLSGGTTGIVDGVSGMPVLTVGDNDATGAANTFAGVIRNTAGSLSLTKIGTGTLTLSGANTYSGATAVNAGTLNITSTGSTAASSAVTVSNSGTALVVDGTVNGTLLANVSTTLSGTGTVNGAATINGTHNPGNSPGIQTFTNGLTYGNTATLNAEFVGNTLGLRGTDFDGVDVTGGNLTIDSLATLALYTSSIDYTDSLWDSARAFTVIDYSGVGTSTGLFTLDTTNAGSFAAEGSWGLANSSNDIILSWTPVPEPSVAALMGVLGGFLLLRRRR